MSRAIPSSLLSALSNSAIEPFFALEFLLDTQSSRLWTGLGNRVINVRGVDRTFTGTGSLLSIGDVEEVGDLSAKNLSVTLSGMDTTVISLALREQYQRRPFRMYFGEQGISDVVEVFSGKIDTLSITDEPESSTISVSIESNLVELERSSNWRYTHESHVTRQSGDTFFSFVQSIQDQNTAWGRKST